MKAFQINQYGDNTVLNQVNISVPQVLPNQVLVKLKSSSVNPVDYKIRSGYLSAMLPKTFPFTLGWEGAGIITEIGDDVSNYKVGDEVMMMPNFMQGGTYAEYVTINADEVVLKPKSLSFAKASIIPFSLGTAFTALEDDAKIVSGQKILIHGAGGAVGQMAVQIAKNKGLYVIGTATGENIQELENLGIDQVIDYTTTDFSSAVSDVDVVLDLVGGETLAKSYDIVKSGGTIVSTTQPPNPKELEAYKLSGKMVQTKMNPSKFLEQLNLIEEGKIKVKKPRILSFSNAIEALSLVEGRKAKSKVVLEF